MHVACSAVTTSPVISLNGCNPAAVIRQACLFWLHVQTKDLKGEDITSLSSAPYSQSNVVGLPRIHHVSDAHNNDGVCLC